LLQAKHGYSFEDAAFLAAQIHDPFSRCAICGMPERWRRAKRDEGWRTPHIQGRLTVDHIDPNALSTLSNTRILCFLCNWLRGPATISDEAVLHLCRAWYENRAFSVADLWWLHVRPGHGGLEQLGI
jgi:hypothetical protein